MYGICQKQESPEVFPGAFLFLAGNSADWLRSSFNLDKAIQAAVDDRLNFAN